MSPTETVPALFTGIVDIHHDDGSYDLDDVVAGGVIALWHKATEGVTFFDPAFVQAMDRARAVGMLRGAYHFASGTSDAVAQAETFVDTVHTLTDHDGILLALDLEGALESLKTMDTRDAVRFVVRVHELTGRWCVLYQGASKARERERLDAEAVAALAKCPLWLAQYGELPTRFPAAWPAWSLWQYTNGADGPHDHDAFPRKTPGFRREAQDRSAFRGDAAALRAWWSTCGT